MSHISPLEKAVQLVGLRPLAAGLGITYVAVRKWQSKGRMPRTEWTGETGYSAKIQEMTAGAVTKESLLASWPAADEQQQATERAESLALAAAHGVEAR